LDLDLDEKKPDGMILNTELARVYFGENGRVQVKNQVHVQVEVQVQVE
jgi:hypothetical protein